MSQFAVAGLQLEISDKDNRYFIQKEIEKALRRFPWINMIVIGELCSFGADTANAETLPGDSEDFYCSLAREQNIWLVPGSLFERDNDRVYNTALAINPEGKVVGRYRKMFPFLPYEKGVTPGTGSLVFEVPDVGRFGLQICYDQWFPETIRELAWLGAEVILCPTMTNTLDRELELTLARANAVSNQCYVFNINAAAPLGNGRSIVVGPDGQVLAQAGERNELIPVEIDLPALRQLRERGVMGLGQTLKSFRDSDMAFGVYAPGARSAGAFAELGELRVPERSDAAEYANWTHKESKTGTTEN